MMRTRLLILLGGLGVFIIACSGANEVSTPLPGASAVPTEEPFYAWDFTMMALDGETYTLSEMRGQWVLVNFWATWCVPCVEEMPVLQSIHERYDDLTVLGINQRETSDAVRDFAEANGIRFPLLLDPPDSVLLDYQVMGLPQTVIVDPDGEIVWRQFGPVELDSFSDEIDALRSR